MTVSNYVIVFFTFFFQERKLGAKYPSTNNPKPSLICAIETRVVQSSNIEIGDHVVFHRLLYDHHGIITNNDGSNFEVIEPAKTRASSIVLTRSSRTFDSMIKGNVSVVNYQASNRSPKRVTASRANEIYEKSRKNPEYYTYNLIGNNCEHFATFCATGEAYSLQVVDFGSRGLPVYIRLKLQEIIGWGKKQSNPCICIPCKNIESKHDIKRGDIIKFFEDDIRQQAVILDIISHTTTTVRCSVAHCDSCASSSSKEIKKKDLDITFEKLFYKLNFESSVFDIENPDDVVKKSNALDEYSRQMAGSLTDACNRFPIWCKLKL